MTWTHDWTGTTSNTVWISADGNTFDALVPARISAKHDPEPQEESPLEWLDRRVEEMRVAL